MNAFLSGLAAMAVIGVGAWYILNHQMDYSSTAVNTSATDGAVRLDPGMSTRHGKDG